MPIYFTNEIYMPYTPEEEAYFYEAENLNTTLQELPVISSKRVQEVVRIASKANYLPLLQTLYMQGTAKESRVRMLQHAAIYNFIPGIEFLLEQKAADPSCALSYAVYYKNASAARLLIKAGADTTLPFFGRRPLTWVAQMGSIECVSILVDMQDEGTVAALIDLDLEKNDTALQAAAQEGHFDIVDFLVSRGASVKQFGHALSRAAQEGHENIVRLLVEATPEGELDAVINSRTPDGATPLLCASLRGHTAIVAYLLSKKANPEFMRLDNSRALTTACLHGYTDIVRLLLAHGAEVKIGPPYPADCAAQGNHVEVLALLREHGVNLTDIHKDTGQAPIHFAATSNAPDAVQYLLDIRAYPNLLDKHKVTPLGWASLEDARPVAELLLRRTDVPIDAEQENIPPLLLAATNGHLQMSEFLLLLGARSDFIHENHSILNYVMHAQMLDKWPIVTVLARYRSTLSEAEANTWFRGLLKGFYRRDAAATHLVSDREIQAIFHQFDEPDHKSTLEINGLRKRLTAVRQNIKSPVSFTFTDFLLMMRVLIKIGLKADMEILPVSQDQPVPKRLEQEAAVKTIQDAEIMKCIRDLHFLEKMIDGKVLNQITIGQDNTAEIDEELKAKLQGIIDILKNTKDEGPLKFVNILNKVVAKQSLVKEDKTHLETIGFVVLNTSINRLLDHIYKYLPTLQILREMKLLHNAEAGLNSLLLRKIIRTENTTIEGPLTFLRKSESQRCLMHLSPSKIVLNALVKQSYPSIAQRATFFDPAPAVIAPPVPENPEEEEGDDVPMYCVLS